MERRLVEYLPPFIQNFKEMHEIMETEQKEFETAWESAENALADQAILTATINGIKRWEKIFGITPKATETLEERRFRVISKLNEQPPYTFEALKNFLNVLLGEGGYTLILKPEKYELTVKLATAKLSSKPSRRTRPASTSSKLNSNPKSSCDPRKRIFWRF